MNRGSFLRGRGTTVFNNLLLYLLTYPPATELFRPDLDPLVDILIRIFSLMSCIY